MTANLNRKLIVDTARKWLGTPYVHQASTKHHGCDCLGLVRGIWREIIGDEPRSIPNYSADWGEVGGREYLKQAVEEFFNCSPKPSANAPLLLGDLILFRWHETAIIKHLGIVTAENRFIHAYEKSGVIESPLVHDWRKRIAGIYCFPGIID